MPRLTKADISGPSNFQHVSGTDRSGHTFGLETYNDQEPKTETKENETPSSPNKKTVSRKNNLDTKRSSSYHLCVEYFS